MKDDGRAVNVARERWEMPTQFQSGKLKERDYMKHVSLRTRLILKLIMNKQNVRMWTGFICLGKGTSVGLL
jgi:hypothetical protein